MTAIRVYTSTGWKDLIVQGPPGPSLGASVVTSPPPGATPGTIIALTPFPSNSFVTWNMMVATSGGPPFFGTPKWLFLGGAPFITTGPSSLAMNTLSADTWALPSSRQSVPSLPAGKYLTIVSATVDASTAADVSIGMLADNNSVSAANINICGAGRVTAAGNRISVGGQVVQGGNDLTAGASMQFAAKMSVAGNLTITNLIFGVLPIAMAVT